jgi:hypothetical protein
MSPRIFKKLCKKAMRILVDNYGYQESSFSPCEAYDLPTNVILSKHVDFEVMTHHETDYWGETDCYNAWLMLADIVFYNSCKWEADPYDSAVTSNGITSTIGILNYRPIQSVEGK